MLLNHVFKNIDEAIDYILVEESTVIDNDKEKLYPFLNYIESNRLIDSFKNPLLGFFNLAPTDKFVMTRLTNERYSLKPNLKKSRFLYRGQNEYHDPCIPSLFRNLSQTYFIEESMLCQELYLLILSHPLVQLMDIGIQHKGETYRFAVNPYGLAQHYYNKTKELDLTKDIDVASFFAVTTNNWETDSYSPILDESSEGVLYYYKLDIERDFKIGHPVTGEPLLTTIGLQIFPRSERQQGFLYELEKGDNFNNNPQVTIVRFQQNAKCSQRIFDKFQGGKILFPDDILMQHWKKENKDKKLLSERTLEFNHRNNPKVPKEMLRSMMADKGYSFEDYIPSFTKVELNEYYKSAISIWENFCSKIYIPGDKDDSFKKTLLNAPYNKEYEWAFNPNSSNRKDLREGYLLHEIIDFIS